MRLAAIALLLSIAALNASGGIVAGDIETGTITGVVFDDINGNGVQDEGEPGLPDKGIGLDGGEANRHLRRTADDGSFVFGALEPGEYVLEAALPTGVGICTDFFFSFNPLIRSWCLNLEFPWHSTPEPVSITVEAGSDHEVELAARPADVAIVAGIALLEDDRPPPGTTIEARVGDTECGSTETTAGVEFNFKLRVLGAREREGCALPGEAVHFVVGGVPAAEVIDYQPFAQRSQVGFQIQHLVAMEDNAWYWFGSDIRSPLKNNVLVEAVVNGTVCGEAEIESRSFGGALGFGRLIVPSAEIEAGCGLPGVDVTFRLDGVRTKGTVAWEPGLHEISLAVSGDVNCDMTLNAIDAALLLQFDAGLVEDFPCRHFADVTGDGQVDSRDATLILQFEAGLLFDILNVDYRLPPAS